MFSGRTTKLIIGLAAACGLLSLLALIAWQSGSLPSPGSTVAIHTDAASPGAAPRIPGTSPGDAAVPSPQAEPPRPAAPAGAPTRPPEVLPTLKRSVSSEQTAIKNFAKPLARPQYVTSLATDSAGNLWIGTEDQGLFRYDPRTEGLKRLTTKDGLGDNNVHALAFDALGRLWVGHACRGISVFNGQAWQTYQPAAGLSQPNTLAGPLGERIFNIVVSPTDGDVWIATSAGLARYHGSGQPATANGSSALENGTWSYYTRAEGLPSDQIQSLAFDAQGRLYAATQCDGLLIADPSNDYKSWRNVRGPQALPWLPEDEGLPTNLLNDVLVARDGTVYLATVAGLAWSKDRGDNWQYVRGGDYAAKVKGLYKAPPGNWASENPSQGNLLSEDYITCLAESTSGDLLLGYRQKGYAVLNPQTLESRPATGTGGIQYVTAILPQSTGQVFVGTNFDGGVLTCTDGAPAKPQAAVATQQPSVAPPFPAGAVAFSDSALTALALRLRSIPTAPATDTPLVVPLTDDWSTQGDWLGRYGRYWVTTTGMDSDYLWGAGRQPVGYIPRIGPHCVDGDCLRFWLGWHSTNSPQDMEMPPVYLHSRVIHGETTWDRNRRPAQHDDHGESLPMTHEGPNIYYSFGVPPGLYFLSFYNSNSHDGGARYRDYRFSVRPFAGQADKLVADDPEEAGSSTRAAFVSLDGFDDRPELASARIRDFASGVYKRFLVRGPANLTIEIHRNGSYNTTNSGIFLDEALNETPDPYFPSVRPARGNGPAASGSPVSQVLAELTSLAVRNPAQWAIHHSLYTELLRSCLAEPASRQSSAAATCLYQSHQFTPWEAIQQQQGLTTAREIEKSLRWDQKTLACTGKGRQIVQAYLAAVARPTTQPLAAVARNVPVRTSSDVKEP